MSRLKLRDALGVLVAAAIFCAPLTLVVLIAHQCERDHAPAADMTAAGPGYPFTVDVSVGPSATLIGAARAGGRLPVSISVYNPTTTACTWGHADADANTDAGVGDTYCTSGCDRDVAMGGDYREIYVDCATATTLTAKMMLASSAD